MQRRGEESLNKKKNDFSQKYQRARKELTRNTSEAFIESRKSGDKIGENKKTTKTTTTKSK